MAKTPKTSVEEFKWWQEGDTKPKVVFEEKVLKIERSFDLVLYEIFPVTKNESCLLPLQTSGIRLTEFPLPLPLPLRKK